MSKKKVISDEEVDALLEEPDTSQTGEVTDYDLAGAQRIVRGRLPTLDLINDRFARYVRVSLENILHRDVEIESLDIRSERFLELINTSPDPAMHNVIRILPWNGHALITFDAPLLSLLVDSFFGGKGTSKEKEDKVEFSRTEKRLANILLTQLYAELKEAWKPIADLTVEFLKTEYNPHFLDIAHPGESLIVSAFNVSIDSAGGQFIVAMPHNMLAPVEIVLDAGPKPDPGSQEAQFARDLRDGMSSAGIKLRAVFTQTQVSLGDLASLAPGDIIPIEAPGTVTLLAGDARVCEGKFGISRGRNAVQLTRVVPAAGRDT